MTHQYLKKSFAVLLVVTALVTSKFSTAITLVNKLNKPIYLDITCSGGGDLGGAKLVKPGGQVSACGKNRATVSMDRDWGKEDKVQKWNETANYEMPQQQLIIKTAYANIGKHTMPVDMDTDESFDLERLTPWPCTWSEPNCKPNGFIKRQRDWNQYDH